MEYMKSETTTHFATISIILHVIFQSDSGVFYSAGCENSTPPVNVRFVSAVVGSKIPRGAPGALPPLGEDLPFSAPPSNCLVR